MSNQALAAARQARDRATDTPNSGAGQVATAPRKDPVGDLIAKLTPQIKMALPAGLNPERVARIALTELRQNEKLAEAAVSNPLSFAGAMLRASTLGFEVGNGLGHAYLLPFEKRRKEGNQWVTVSIETQLIIGYRGMIELARRSGQIESLYAVEVYRGEIFEVELGLSNDIKHKRDFSVDTSPDNVVAVYAVAKLKGGEVQFEVMGRNQIEAIRARSKSKDNGPWVTDWAEMAKKTVVRRLFKYLPVSVEVKTSSQTRSISLEQIANDDGGMTIDASTGEIITQQQYEPQKPVEQSRDGFGQGGDVNEWIGKIRAASSTPELDEILIRAEGELSGVDLETANQAYRQRKQDIGSLI